MADAINYKILTFYIDAPTPKDYSNFISKLRIILTGSTLDKYNLPILRSESEAQGKLYCYVNVSYNNNVLTLGFDVVDLNLVAFKFESTSYFFSNTKDNDLFYGTVKVVLPFSNTFASLGDRAAVKLGIHALQNAVSVLTSFHQHEVSAVKTSIINVIQMVLEATKLKLIEDAIIMNFDKDIPIDIVMISYEDNWAKISKNIINANDNGDFPETVYVVNLDGTTRALTNVRDVKAKMGILKYYPRTEAN